MLTSCYGMSVAQLLDQANQSNPNKEVIFDGSRRMTYRDLQTEATELASGLQLMGVQKG
ncbi:MAG TPA: long-chain acyl-CoA synthetase, partial [Clostridiales bacterium]|nr:long-chain acyl-CoA synthetase [Clostridiales bacterium]